MEKMGRKTDEGPGRTHAVSGIPHLGNDRRVPEYQGVIARRTQGTTKLRMAECSHADIHKHRVRTANSPHEDYPPTLQ